MNIRFDSELLQRAVSELSKLPGVGEKSALRLALHLLRQPKDMATTLGQSIIDLRNKVVYCKHCHNISALEICKICDDNRRQNGCICVVESVRDVMAIESTGVYHGLYHVLGGLISPADGIGPADIEIDSLIKRAETENIHEIILALNPTIEGDTTSFYIFKHLQKRNIKLTTLARGMSVSSEIEYADELTLGRSIQGRVLFND